MRTNKPRITSITANYNNGPYLIECINGLMNQTVTVDNIVIVDDKSTDNSWEILEKFIMSLDSYERSPEKMSGKKRNQSFSFIKKNVNSGPAETRNIGLMASLDYTDIVCICDSDDVYYTTKVEESLRPMMKYKDVALVYSDYNVLNQKTGGRQREFKEVFSYDRLSEECIVSNNSVIEANIFKHIGLYDPSLFGPEDYDLWLRISECALVYHVPIALYDYRITGNNLTIATTQQRLAQHVNRVHQKKVERRNANR